MNGEFQKLDRDDDIVLLDGEPLSVTMIKEIVTAHIYGRVHYFPPNQSHHKTFSWVVINQLSQQIVILLNPLKSRQTRFKALGLKESKWIAFTQEIESKVIFTEISQGSQTGKVRIKIEVAFFPEEYSSYVTEEKLKTDIKIDVEFCPELPIEAESPLDDLRQTEDYQRLL